MMRWVCFVMAIALCASCTGSGDDPDASTATSEPPAREPIEYHIEYEDAHSWEDPCVVLWMGTTTDSERPSDVRVNGSRQYDSGPVCAVTFELGSSSAVGISVSMWTYATDIEAEDSYLGFEVEPLTTDLALVLEIDSPWSDSERSGWYSQDEGKSFMGTAVVQGPYFILVFYVTYPGVFVMDDVCAENEETSFYEPPCVADPELVAAYLETIYLPAFHDHLAELQGI